MKNFYNLLIVDDEFVIRDGLTSYNWEAFGFKAIGQAPNGKKALEFIKDQTVDVILTDIKMPVMDGLELSRSIHAAYPECKVIILTGYDDFNYAKSAISTNVYEYILKPIDNNNLDNVFAKLKTELDKEKNKSIILSMSERNIRERFFMQILEQKVTDINDIEEKMDLLEITLNRSNYSCVVCQLNNIQTPFEKKTFNAQLFCFIKLLDKYFNKHNIGYFYINDLYQLICILNYEVTDKKMTPQSYVSSVLIDVKNIVENFWNKHISTAPVITAGNIYNSLMSVSASYREAQKLLKKKFYENSNIFLAWEYSNIHMDNLFEYPYKSENDLINVILEGDKNQVSYYFETFWESFSESVKQIEPSRFKDIMTQFLNVLERKLIVYRISLENTANLKYPYNTEVEHLKTLCDLKEFIERAVMDTAVSMYQLHNRHRTSCHLAIEQAKKYIAEHYHKKITLKEIADYVYLNASYFSIQFKKETGKKYIEYLKEFRINKAKEMLKQNSLKVYQISEQVGYDNPKYFTNAFKEYTGFSPLEYRQKITADWK